ncbi:hypothetical protein [Sutcliffiella deserti]|uniref:hypothetical protein n=1 Tax=Sutcliffiella deserti TaxID=2875501 RepID=UPI001CBE3643|nr:hypothetical protein [Sutcliffiella deserti]
MILSSKSHAHIYLGSMDKNHPNFSMGRLHFYINWAYFGFCSWDATLDKRQKIAALAGGPIVSLLLACIFGKIMIGLPQGELRSVLLGIAIFNIFSFLVTAIPMNYPRWWRPYQGRPSDGLQLLRLLREY